MNILIAPDSFKGSLSAVRAAGVIAASIARCDPAARCILLPQADGGEGSLEVLESACGGVRHAVQTVDPRGRPLTADWLSLPDGSAVIESALAIGYDLLSEEQRKPSQLRSTGLGILLRAIADSGAEEVLVALGGSATNDAGLGCAEALGFRFRYQSDPGNDVLRALRTLRSVEPPDTGLDLRVTALADVRNPLCGPRGATVVYGPQKGIFPDQLQSFDRALAHFSSIVRRDLRFVDTAAPGMGAAGGLGFALAAFTGATLRSGAEYVRSMTGFTEVLEQADVVITGEGQLDAQSREGKVVSGVAEQAHRRGIPAVAFAGTITGSPARAAETLGLSAAIRVTPENLSRQEGMQNAEALLAEAVTAFWPGFSGTR